jgi:hypothetical protein
MTFLDFLANLNRQIGIPLPDDWISEADEVALAKKVLEKLNEYFFQTYEGIGTTRANEKEYQYFSEFHKYWETHHAEIINARIVREQACITANALHLARINYGDRIFNVTLDTHGLPQQAIAQVRFFTANQDFREPPEDQFNKFLVDDTQFSEEAILDNPNGFLGFLGMSRLSQSDKRLDYARNAAEYLVARGITAYDIARYNNNDALQIRESFLASTGMGYGRKKTDMFIRDMYVLGVWPHLSNMQAIDVASDRNTMKLALRTRILQTDIPLLSSFLDIFGYQYGYIDAMSAAAWRAVWEEWQAIAPNTAPISPCMMDFLLYRIGREHCDDKVVEFVCQNEHRFFNFSAQLKKCRICRSEIIPIRRALPCQIQKELLPRHENGRLRLDAKDLLYIFNGECIFEVACQPTTKNFKKLSPPKAISIVGRTSWTDSYANQGEGGGGMMG